MHVDACLQDKHRLQVELEHAAACCQAAGITARQANSKQQPVLPGSHRHVTEVGTTPSELVHMQMELDDVDARTQATGLTAKTGKARTAARSAWGHTDVFSEDGAEGRTGDGKTIKTGATTLLQQKGAGTFVRVCIV